ncbi:MAG: hypothetical protein IPK82_00590 [Polyangiaceae bacterium]|nr:hypothetical protein [Polyangiaceae bacterium]
MSIELEVEMGETNVPIREFLRKLSAELASRCTKDSMLDPREWVLEKHLDAILGGEECNFEITIHHLAAIAVACLWIPQVSPGKPGWWVSMTALTRCPEGMFLLTAAAASLAQIAGKLVVDDALLLGVEPTLSPSQVFSLLPKPGRRSFQDAATEFGKVHRLW